MSAASADARVVIVGAGQGGQQVAASLRQEGFGGSITLIGDEPGLPYQRPPLSKAYLKDGDAARLLLKPAAFYERGGIALHDRTRVVRIDRSAGAVETEAGVRHEYDHLVLATGARTLRPPIPGLAAAGPLELRTVADAALIRARLAASRRAVVIGGGFIGLEFAAVARAAGLDVSVVEAADRLMARVVSPAISERFLVAHRGWGVRVRLGDPACGVAPAADGGHGVALASGETVAGDLLLVATGVVPNAELAAEAGLAVDDGVVVDATLLTEDPAISAIGDCASFPGPDGRRVRLESVQAAVDHGRHVARRIAHGDAAAYAAVPWFWSDQGDLKLQIAGLSGDADARVVLPEGGPAAIVLSFHGERLVAVETVNAAGPHMAARRLLAGGEVTRATLAGAGFDLRTLAKAAG